MQAGTPQQRAPVNERPGHRSLRNVKQQYYLKTTSNVPSLIMGYVTGQAYRFKILLNLYVIQMFYFVSVRYIYIAMSGRFQCKTSECLVSFKFLSMSCMVVFSDHFITKSCYFETKIFAGLLICQCSCDLLLVFQGQ